MKTQQWLLGVFVSFGISVLAISPRLFRTNHLDWDLLVNGIFYNAVFCIYSWSAHFYLIHRRRSDYPRVLNILYAAASITGVALSIYILDFLSPGLTNRSIANVESLQGNRAGILAVRGFIISGFFYFISYYLMVLEAKQKAAKEVSRLKQAQLEANIASLKEQLSPHFLFNTLNTLSSLTQEKNVKDYIAELANVYRYVLQYKELNVATVKHELNFIESYLYILKARLEDAIEVKINVDDAVLLSKIPPLTLQLLIENAVKHNIASRTKQLKIEIKNVGSFLLVWNNLQLKTSTQSSAGIGLNSVMQRYLLLFGREIIIEKTNTAFIVKLPII